MNYYPHHIGDYGSATAHLTMLEDAAYRRLMDWYYQAEAPIPADERAIFRRVRAASEDEREAVRAVLGEFFQREGDVYRHRRCDAEIARAQEKSEKARQSVAQRRDRKPANVGENGCSTNVEPVATNVGQEGNERSTPNSQEPIANSQTKGKKPPPAAALARPDEVPEQVWLDWQKVRAAKRSGAVTATALAGIRREAEEAGLSLAEAIAVCCARSWVGFRADWYAKTVPQARASPQPSAQQQRSDVIAELTGRRPKEHPNVIDVPARIVG